MRINKILLAALFSLVFAAWGTSAYASCYANFSGNCSRTSDPAFCVFDGNRTYDNGHTSDLTPTTCGSSSVGMVFWEFEFENPNGPTTWDDLTTAYTYQNPGAIGNDARLRMTLFCADGCIAYKERLLYFVLVGPGDMYCNAGWN